MALNEKQTRFVEEYLIDLNATQAAIRAGYSPQTAEQIAYQLLQKTSVKNAIARAKAERSRRTGITQDRVLQELARVAFLNPAEVLNLNTAEVLASAEEDNIRVISGVKVKYVPHKDYDEEGEIVIETAIEREVKLCDKLKALDMLCKHLGLYDKDKPGDDEDEGSGVVMLAPVMDNPGPPVPTEGGASDG